MFVCILSSYLSIQKSHRHSQDGLLSSDSSLFLLGGIFPVTCTAYRLLRFLFSKQRSNIGENDDDDDEENDKCKATHLCYKYANLHFSFRRM